MKIVKAQDTDNDTPFDVWMYYIDLIDLPPDDYRVVTIKNWAKKAKLDIVVFPYTIWFKTEADAMFFLLSWQP